MELASTNPVPVYSWAAAKAAPAPRRTWIHVSGYSLASFNRRATYP